MDFDDIFKNFFGGGGGGGSGGGGRQQFHFDFGGNGGGGGGHQQFGDFGGFGDFFNMGGGFGGGQGHGHQQRQQGGNRQQQKEAEPLFKNTKNVLSLSFSALSTILRREITWLVVFYHPGDQNAQAIEEPWTKVADKLNGIVRVASVNCAKEEELCEEYTTTNSPPQIL